MYLGVKCIPESKEDLGLDHRWGSTFAGKQQVINCSEVSLPIKLWMSDKIAKVPLSLRFMGFHVR